ncbi:MAG: DUF89 family protein [FCB group bacterium]|nr:DUF89 family protein [FCB group bacterium]
MKTYIDCIPCFLNQSLKVVRKVGKDELFQAGIMKEILAALSTADFSRPPPQLKSLVDGIISRKTGISDLYEQDKKYSNDLVMPLYPDLKQQVDKSDDPFSTALRLAIAGNVVDFGAYGSVDFADIRRSLDQAMTQSLDQESIERLRRGINLAGSILYVGDNSGEIVLDKLFIENLPMEKITFAVRGKPCINDVLMEDAAAVGITNLVEVIDSGSGIPGTVLEECSPEFVKKFRESDLIIAKGQGNYETLNDSDKNICFLFKIKCPVVAEDTGVPLDDISLIWSAGKAN